MYKVFREVIYDSFFNEEMCMYRCDTKRESLWAYFSYDLGDSLCLCRVRTIYVVAYSAVTSFCA